MRYTENLANEMAAKFRTTFGREAIEVAECALETVPKQSDSHHNMTLILKALEEQR